MLVTLYKSALCPRCHVAKKHLYRLKETFPEVEIEEIDILTSPTRAINARIRMIPAIVIGEKTLSSIYLSRKKIADFIQSSL